jgi:hypothetical protein
MKGTNMQKRGGGRFGKYGDLKRKEKIRQTRLLKRDDSIKQSGQWPSPRWISAQKKPLGFKQGFEALAVIGEPSGLDKERKPEDDKR